MSTIAPWRWPAVELLPLIDGGVHVWSVAEGEWLGLLAAYAAVDPAELRVERGPNGKPFVAHPQLDWLRFSRSHTADVSVLAVAANREVGIDVEAIRPDRRVDAVAGGRFTPAEVAWLRDLHGAQRDVAFHRLWARKEAYLKATGEGLAGGLASFDALAMRPPDGAEGWEFADVDAGAGYAAALALSPPGYSPGG